MAGNMQDMVTAEKTRMLNEETRLREIAELHCTRPGSSKPYMITVASGKGGAGKSTVALNLAVGLAERGHRTLLLDADENLGNIDVMAGLSPTLRLGDILRGERDMQDVLVTPMKNLSILPGNSGDPDYPGSTWERQQELLNDISGLEQQFEFLVVDTSPGVGRDVVNFAVHADETLVVTTPEPTALMDAYALIKMITLADALVPISVVINAARTRKEANDTARKLQMAIVHFLHREVNYLGSIPFDTNVTRAIIQQGPLLKAFPDTVAALALYEMTGRLLQRAVGKRVRRFQTA